MRQFSNNKEKRLLGSIPVYDFLFIIAFGVWLVSRIVYLSFAVQFIDISVLGLMRNIGLVLSCTAYLCYGKWNASDVIAIFISIIVLYIKAQTNAPAILDCLVFCFCGRYISFDVVLKESAVISTVLLLTIVACAFKGILPNYIDYASIGRVRQYIGFRYALFPAMILFNITCGVCYISRSHLNLKTIALLLIANTFIFLLTDSRLSFFISVFVIIGIIILQKTKKSTIWNIILKYITPISFVGLFIVSFIIVNSYDPTNPFYSRLNEFLGNRLLFAQRALNTYGTSLFGQPIQFIGNGIDVTGHSGLGSGAYNYVDMLFILLPVQYGWIFTIIFLVLSTRVAVMAMEENDYCLLVILLAIALHCFVDDLAIYLYYNSFIFLIGRSRRKYSYKRQHQLHNIFIV